ncbi:MAG TPA: hypothetical protein VML75_03900 [Kofleriaceae bacterium]|nr:hypothetical protein [Kofleriaceae bacterium]
MDQDLPPVPPAPDVGANEFRCPSCAGEMQWDAGAGALRCQYCEEVVTPPESEADASIVEYDLEHGIAMSRQRGYGTPVRTSTCQACGATVSFGDNVTATKCDFCDSPQVMQQEGNRNMLRPESLVPFQIAREVATGKFTTWLGKLWFRPSDLKHRAEVDDIDGVYVPYWTFDATVDSRWTAQAGYYYYETERYTERDAQGNTVTRERQVRKTRWRWANGTRTDLYDDLLVCASRGLPHELAAKLTSFDTAHLVPYEPHFLAGWKAEEYAVELNDAWKTAVANMQASQHGRCSRDVPGDTQRFLSVQNQFHDERFKHVLLPIWIASYRYGDEIYRFLVNGQTGEVTGKAPLSWTKIILFAAAIVALIVGTIVLVRSR